jgi:hypothetical protein
MVYFVHVILCLNGDPSASMVTANHWLWVTSKSELCYNQRSVGQSVLVSSPHLGPNTKFLLMSESCVFVDVGRHVWREDGSVVYSCCWSSTAQSSLGPSPAGLMTIFYCLRFDTANLEGQVPAFISPRNRVTQLYPQALVSLFVASCNLQGYDGGIRNHLHTGSVLFHLYSFGTDHVEIPFSTVLLLLFVHPLQREHVHWVIS